MPDFTKREIKAAFIDLLNERPLNQITIKDIVERCGINRNSFYYHFHDMPALIEEIVTEEADRIIAEYPTIDSIETGLEAAIDFAEKKRKAILHIYNSVNRDIFEQYLWRVCQYVVVTYGKTAFPENTLSVSDKNVVIQFYMDLCFGMVIDWMNNNMQSDIHSQVHRICELHKGMIEEMIRRSVS